MLKNISRRDLIQNFHAPGFNGFFGCGKHQLMKRGELKDRIPNPHQSDVDASLLSRILRQAEISHDEWTNA